jgi:inosine-uridine nucleoside N-ribohydrolase
MLGRDDIPVASGARISMTTGKVASPFTGDTRYWPDPVEPQLSGAADAMDLLETSIRGGATVVCIGPVTNIAMFETFRGDMLRDRRLVVMGGYVAAPDAGFPQWGAEHDWNVQWDTRAMETVVNMDVSLTLVPYPVTMHATLTMRDLERIEQTGQVGQLIALQSRSRAEDADMTTIGRNHPAMPDDLMNFHYDPVAVAVALGWEGAKVERQKLMPYVENGILSFETSPTGRPIDVCTAVDGEAFTAVFVNAIREAQR